MTRSEARATLVIGVAEGMRELNEHFVTGRLRKRLLRAPIVEGWLCQEHNITPPERAALPLTKVSGQLALKLPGKHDLAKLSVGATAVAEKSDLDILIGWPEELVILRRAGSILHADGDVVHFGRLCLDREHSIERTGYEYLSADGIEVRVELSVTTPNGEQRSMMDPGSSIEVGPYVVEHVRSYDPSDRPSAARQHGYSFRVTRAKGAPISAPDPALPHPLDVTDPAELARLARAAGSLGSDEALVAEPAELERVYSHYEGPRQQLDQLMHQLGESTLRRRGEVVEIESSYLGRGNHGEPVYGRATVRLDPAGGVTVTRAPLGSAPGRLRRAERGMTPAG